jgi:LuxR family maltose regulon positive regulatory protein
VGSIDRSRVDDLLEEACAHRLTVVAAGPGWGKTTAVSGWLARRSPDDVAVGWLTLTDDADNPAAFWDGVLAALRSSGAVPADHPLAALSADAGMSAEVLVALFNGLDSLTRPVLLVLDDFHVIEHPDVLDEVARMLEHLSALRLLLLTRIHPALPLGRLRLSGDLVEITAEDLAFDADEMDALARGAALSVDEPTVVSRSST